jgi:uncharacterized damage-inducible protein DinB
MKKTLITIVALSMSTASSAFAQFNEHTATSAMKSEWQMLSGWIAKAADQMPEADYAFKPTPDVRSFGQLIGHLAGSQDYICAAALGDTAGPPEDAVEKTMTAKAQLVAAFKASTDRCVRAYTQQDAELHGATKLFGMNATRLSALLRNTVHDGEHYGNIVTYMRLKKMVPPSSQPRMTP